MPWEPLLALAAWVVFAIFLTFSIYLRLEKKDVCDDESDIKVTYEDGQGCRVFKPWGDVTYKRDQHRLESPGLPGEKWHKRTVTVHTLTWETVNYE